MTNITACKYMQSKYRDKIGMVYQTMPCFEAFKITQYTNVLIRHPIMTQPGTTNVVAAPQNTGEQNSENNKPNEN